MGTEQIWSWFNAGGWLITSLTLVTLLGAILVFYFFNRKLHSYIAAERENTASDQEKISRPGWATPVYDIAAKLVSFLAAIVILILGTLIIFRILKVEFGFLFRPALLWLLDSGLRLALIFFAALIALRVANSLANNLGRFILPGKESLDAEEQRRLKTLQNVTGSILKLLVIMIAVIMILREIGFDVTALVTAAGIGGLALSLGAQDLIRDYISGFFLLSEDQARVGDVVEINKISGMVEQLTLRTITLRSLDGTLHVIPNRQVTTVSNMTKSFSRYVIDVEIAYKENVDHVMAVLRELGNQLETDSEFGELVLEPLEILGVDKFGSSGVVIKIMITTPPLKQWQVGRELRRRIKNRFDQLGIEIPFPHVSLYWGSSSHPVEVSLLKEKVVEREFD